MNFLSHPGAPSCILQILMCFIFIFIQLNVYLISFVTYSLTYGFFRSVLYNYQMFGDFTEFQFQFTVYALNTYTFVEVCFVIQDMMYSENV